MCPVIAPTVGETVMARRLALAAVWIAAAVIENSLSNVRKYGFARLR